MKMMEYVPEYEAQIGKQLEPQLMEFIKKLDAVGAKFTRKGSEDAAQGLPASSDDAFQSWGNKLFDDDPELAVAMADLMKICYMEGYEQRANKEKVEGCA